MTSEVYVVFGGSGFIGTHLSQRLSQDGAAKIYSVDIRPPRIAIPNVEHVTADVRDLSALSVPEPVTAIFNLAAVHTTPGHPTHEYYETNVMGALQINDFAERHGVDRLVFTSSISVYGPGESTKSETTPLTPQSAYGWSKYLAEQIARGWVGRGADRRLVVCRPAVIFGHGEGGNFTRLAKMLKAGFFVYPGRKDTIKACFYVSDLVDSLLMALARNETVITYNGAYPDRYTIEQIVDTFREVAFPKARTFLVPRGIVVFAARLLKGSFGSIVGIHPERVEKLITSTDVMPDWLITADESRSGRLRAVLEDWKRQSDGRFD